METGNIKERLWCTHQGRRANRAASPHLLEGNDDERNPNYEKQKTYTRNETTLLKSVSVAYAHPVVGLWPSSWTTLIPAATHDGRPFFFFGGSK